MMRLNAEMRAPRTSLHALFAAIGLTTAAAVVMPAAARAATPGSYEADHTQAVAALADIQAAITTIMHAEDAATAGPAAYKTSASQAINALVGAQDGAFNAKAGNPGDAAGAIGHVNQLLDRTDTPPWVPELHGVLVNAQAAVSALQDAHQAHDLDAYELSASQALTDLEVAQGRASEYDALGGLSGALANTALAVTDGAAVENGCEAPHRAGFGVYQGYLSYRAVPLSSIGRSGIDNPGGTKIHLHDGMLVFYTAAAPQVVHICAATHAEAQRATPDAVLSAPVAPAVFASTGRSPLLIEAADIAGGAPALYTTAQASAGAQIYAQNCASCHGANLQGVAAPALAGHDFQKTAVSDKYSVSIVRTIATQNMPLSNPGSLSDTQYADVMAYLLAANCYPAGTKPFPTQDEPALKVIMGPPSAPSGTPDANGVCAVH
ncbi:MAG TPA: cytochrome c [Acidocella sp.]|jgi:mono/diheme cytochrome c family protein|nr:cytochrome c [Acidocella sp.]